MGDDFIVPPPASMETLSEPNRVVLYTDDGRALVRQIGFRTMAQTTGTNPPLSGNTKYGDGKKGGKKKRGWPITSVDE